MDWAIQAARRKTQRLPGGSRSIIETLNVFNNVSEEGQERIDAAIREANEWLNGEVLVERAETGKLPRQEEERSAMVSPEKTLNNSEFDAIEEAEGVPASGTPLRVVREVPSTTPKSLADDNYTDEVAKGQDPAVLKAVSGKVSPWSPFRNEKSLRGSVADPTSAPSSRTENSRATDKWGLTEEVRTSTASDSNVTSKSLEQFVRDRSQRRSNMFVPLPSRDPLVVQQAVPTLHKVPSGALLPSSASPRDPIATQVAAEKKSLSMHPKPVLTDKGVAARTMQSPTYSSTSTKISQATSSVFDRLSSLPTKSFENKVTSKFAGRRISASSSIDVTGSPIRRTSPVHRGRGSTETTYQDTLKNIFFAKDKRSDWGSRSSKHGATLARTRHVDTTRVGKNSDGRISPRSRNAKIPKYHASQTENNRGYQKNKTGFRALQKADITERKTVPLKHSGEQSNTARESPGKSAFSGSSISRSPAVKPQPIDKSASRTNADPQLNDTLHETHESHIRSLKNKSKNQDRLTKFQLIPPAESESHDLKEKLNKRLSEVMRTQQNQQRRRIDQQKRKSQLDEDFQRRTRLWNEMKETSFSLSAAVRRNSNVIATQTNTVLYDLSITDHRTVIGEEAESRDPTVGNHTLPEIPSDSDDDADFTLASWAKSPFLQQQLHRQQNWDPSEIFGPLPPLHIDQIFPNIRTNKLKPLQSSSRKI